MLQKTFSLSFDATASQKARISVVQTTVPVARTVSLVYPHVVVAMESDATIAVKI